MRPAYVYGAALAITAAGGTQVQAAVLLGEVATSLDPGRPSREAAARRLTVEDRFDHARARHTKALTYDLGTATMSDLNFESPVLDSSMLLRKRNKIGLAEEAGAKWSPRITNWSGPEATLHGFGRRRPINAHSGLVRVFDRHLVHYRFTLSRRRIKLKLTTNF